MGTKRNEQGDFVFDDTLGCYGHHDTVFRCPVCSIRGVCFHETMRLLKVDPEPDKKPCSELPEPVSGRKPCSEFPDIPYDKINGEED